MPRNGSGTYSKVNTFAAGATITSSGHNQNWDDLATEMTNSVAADGQTSMTGALKAAAGTAALPGMAFASDTNTGIYRIAGDNLGVACAGAKVLDVSATGLNVTGEVSRSGFPVLLVGEIKIWPVVAAPSGWLVCNGASLLRASYPDLFTAIGTTFGAADGSHFNIPDITGRVPAGREASSSRLTSTYFVGNSTVMGATGGGESHTLSTAELPAHSHGVTDSGHQHSSGPAGTFKIATSAVNVSGGAGNAVLVDGGTTINQLSTTVNTTGVTINNAGSGNPHATVQPSIILNYIIFAGV